MKIIYLDTSMGVNGTKLYGALLGLCDDPDTQLRKLNDLGIKHLRAERHEETQNGISGYRVDFRWTEAKDGGNDEIKRFSRPGQRRRKLSEIIEMIEDLPLTGEVRRKAISIYEDMAQACAAQNGTTPDATSFHMSDTKAVIASVIGVCMLMDKLNCDRVISSPVTVGMGYTETSKGTVPIPIRAVKTLLEGIPFVSGKEEGELCTVEGAALIKHFVDTFEEMPALKVEKNGNGFGRHPRETGANCIRAYIGNEADSTAEEAVTALEANVFSDDSNILSNLAKKLTALNVHDAYVTEITSLDGIKEKRLKCVCPRKNADKVAEAILSDSSALSVTRSVVSLYKKK